MVQARTHVLISDDPTLLSWKLSYKNTTQRETQHGIFCGKETWQHSPERIFLIFLFVHISCPIRHQILIRLVLSASHCSLRLKLSKHKNAQSWRTPKVGINMNQYYYKRIPTNHMFWIVLAILYLSLSFLFFSFDNDVQHPSCLILGLPDVMLRLHGGLSAEISFTVDTVHGVSRMQFSEEQQNTA